MTAYCAATWRGGGASTGFASIGGSPASRNIELIRGKPVSTDRFIVCSSRSS